jgi:hypothetical protein
MGDNNEISPGPSSMQPRQQKRPTSERLRDLWPDIRELVLPRRGLLLGGFLLMFGPRACRI